MSPALSWNPNTRKVKKNTWLISHNATCEFSWQIPLSSDRKNPSTTVNQWKMKCRLFICLCSDRYIISVFPHLHSPAPPALPPFSPALISRMVSVDIKHHVYLPCMCVCNWPCVSVIGHTCQCMKECGHDMVKRVFFLNLFDVFGFCFRTLAVVFFLSFFLFFSPSVAFFSCYFIVVKKQTKKETNDIPVRALVWRSAWVEGTHFPRGRKLSKNLKPWSHPNLSFWSVLQQQKHDTPVRQPAQYRWQELPQVSFFFFSRQKT